MAPQPAASAGSVALQPAAAAGPSDPDVDAGPATVEDTELATPVAEPVPGTAERVTPDAPIAFDPPGGGFIVPFELRLSTRLPNAEIHYTLDGTLPTNASPLYDAPIMVSATSLVRARATSETRATPTIQHSYLRLAEDAAEASSNLPLMVVHRLGHAPPDVESHEFVSAVFAVFEPQDGRARLAGPATWSGRLGVKVRGRTSRSQPKRSFTIELRGEQEEDLPLPLMGMPAEGDWVLYAPYTRDRSMMRNALMYELSRRMGRYAPRTRFCELYFVSDHADVQAQDYAGVYVLTERVTRGDERIDIHKLGTSLTGGYIMQVDDPDAPEEAFSAADQTFVYVDPDYDEITNAQASYLKEYLNGWNRAIRSDDGTDPENGNAYQALMDIPSFVDHHILNLLAKNPDAFRLSAYYYKDRSGPLCAGPIWDMELGLGNRDDKRSLDPASLDPLLSTEYFMLPPYDALFARPSFVEAYWQRWDELLETTLTAHAVRELLADYQHQLSEAELRNRTRWPDMTPANGDLGLEAYRLSNWLDMRLQWIHAELGLLQ